MKQMTILFLRREQEVLLAMKKRGFGNGRWNGVGGKVEAGETPEEATRRECFEEITVRPQSIKKVAELIFNEMHLGTREQLFAHVYTCEEWEGTPTETEEMAPQWFSVDSIPYDDMWPDDVYWLPKVMNGKLVQGEFVFDDSDNVIESRVKEVVRL